jgi:hypothetical protein
MEAENYSVNSDGKHELYNRAFCRTINNCKSVSQKDAKLLVKKAIFYGLKYVTSKPEPKTITREIAESEFNIVCILKSMMGMFTPAEFTTMFPIEKEFNGHKYGFKDYFYTRDYVNSFPQNEPIGEDAIVHFLWEYMNWDITDFNVYSMGCISNLRKLEGKTTLAEELADVMGWKTYKMYTDAKGKQYLLDRETGKTMKVRKPRPRYLKVIKGER